MRDRKRHSNPIPCTTTYLLLSKHERVFHAKGGEQRKGRLKENGRGSFPRTNKKWERCPQKKKGTKRERWKKGGNPTQI